MDKKDKSLKDIKFPKKGKYDDLIANMSEKVTDKAIRKLSSVKAAEYRLKRGLYSEAFHRSEEKIDSSIIFRVLGIVFDLSVWVIAVFIGVGYSSRQSMAWFIGLIIFACFRGLKRHFSALSYNFLTQIKLSEIESDKLYRIHSELAGEDPSEY